MEQKSSSTYLFVLSALSVAIEDYEPIDDTILHDICLLISKLHAFCGHRPLTKRKKLH